MRLPSVIQNMELVWTTLSSNLRWSAIYRSYKILRLRLNSSRWCLELIPSLNSETGLRRPQLSATTLNHGRSRRSVVESNRQRGPSIRWVTTNWGQRVAAREGESSQLCFSHTKAVRAQTNHTWYKPRRKTLAPILYSSSITDHRRSSRQLSVPS